MAEEGLRLKRVNAKSMMLRREASTSRISPCHAITKCLNNHVSSDDKVSKSAGCLGSSCAGDSKVNILTLLVLYF